MCRVSAAMSSCDSPVARLVFQRCNKAKLLLSEEFGDENSNSVSIDEGLIVFIAFLGDVTPKLSKLINIICDTKLCEKEGKYVSVLDFPGDILLIPQFCLGGRLKGKQFQYHSVVSKTDAENYFKAAYDGCCKKASKHSEWITSGRHVYAGTYGIRQNLTTHSNGPFIHIVEI